MKLNSEKGIYLEISRQRKAVGKGAFSGTGKMRFVAWCHLCRGKVELVAAEERLSANPSTEARHIQVAFAGKLLACFNSLNQAA